jgi:hypothetical protein
MWKIIVYVPTLKEVWETLRYSRESVVEKVSEVVII